MSVLSRVSDGENTADNADISGPRPPYRALSGSTPPMAATKASSQDWTSQEIHLVILEPV